jgi:hypothetical protein
MIRRSAGRILETPEKAIVLGSFQGRLWYKIISQKSDGGSLTEGGQRSWFFDESEVVDDGIELLKPTLASSITLPILDRFRCTSEGGIKVTYANGALLRSDIEISEMFSKNLGVIPVSTIIPCEHVLERRFNSDGVVRFRVIYPPLGKGWISYRIRGGSEEQILELIGPKKTFSNHALTDPAECAAIWMAEYSKLPCLRQKRQRFHKLAIETLDEFENAFYDGVIDGMRVADSDSLIATLLTSVADSTAAGNALDCSYDFFCSSIYSALKLQDKLNTNDVDLNIPIPEPGCYQSVASKVACVHSSFPEMKSIVARAAMVRAFNRRCKVAISLFSLRPPQENSAVLGGYVGLGASVERSGLSRNTDLLQNVSLIIPWY